MTLSLPLYLIINVLIKKIMSQKIRIKLKSYDHNLVDKSAEKIVRTVKATGAIVSGGNTSAYAQAYLYCEPFDFRKQKVS